MVCRTSTFADLKTIPSISAVFVIVMRIYDAWCLDGMICIASFLNILTPRTGNNRLVCEAYQFTLKVKVVNRRNFVKILLTPVSTLNYMSYISLR